MAPTEKKISPEEENALKVEKIFRPGINIDIVFDMDSSSPIVRASRLHEIRYESQVMIVSQTNPQILPSFKNRKMDVTTLVRLELNRKFRGGIACEIVKFVKNYQLSDQIKEDSILIKYFSPARKVNIRAAFRLEPTANLEIGGKLIFQDAEYYSGRDYKIHNISNTGIGLLIPKDHKKGKNRLEKIGLHENAIIELDLIDFNAGGARVSVKAEIVIVRKHVDFNKKSGFIGIRFEAADRTFEKILSKFIHEAQLYERRMATKSP